MGGIRVLDLTRYLPGPLCTQILAELGADVVKVESPPLGDPMRALPPLEGDDTAAHAALNRDKKSVAIDWRNAAGAEVVRRLAANADVLIESVRPGALAKRGLGPEPLLLANPRLVYCCLSAFGREGPLAGRVGHDIDVLARSGFLDANRGADGAPVLPGGQVADILGGLVAALGILAALRARETTGRGQLVDASMLDGMRALMAVPWARSRAGAERADELRGSFACYRVYRCRDGRELAVGALERPFWEGLCRALGQPALASRQWEVAGQAEIVAALQKSFGERDRDEWLAALGDCVEPLVGLGEAGMPPAPLLRLHGTPGRIGARAPKLGEHTDAVLAEAGFAALQIAELREAGAIA